MVFESLKVVDDQDDGYEANDISLTRVVASAALDVAILRTHAPLKIMPYRVGRSAALRVGNVVAVHGFPLGAFRATNVGKVINTYDHDTSNDWDHVDFVTDAQLSAGNSGSPVLAVSCKTGEYELVGV
jgi:serine protease Do